MLLGWSIENTSTTATAAVDILDATDGDTDPIFPITLLANESSREWFGDSGIVMQTGIYLDVTSGSVKGALFIDAGQT